MDIQSDIVDIKPPPPTAAAAAAAAAAMHQSAASSNDNRGSGEQMSLPSTPESRKKQKSPAYDLGVLRVRKKWSFGKGFFFRKVHFLEILENLDSFLEIVEILENPQTLENKGDSELLLEILENVEI